MRAKRVADGSERRGCLAWWLRGASSYKQCVGLCLPGARRDEAGACSGRETMISILAVMDARISSDHQAEAGTSESHLAELRART